jgi:glycosyltransferase involved in cell wall biosynthesis/peptidoglycan/xylan/chitin deacetylase (PgdA/CDA1 family)
VSPRRRLFVSSFAPVLGSGRALRTYTCVRALATLGPVDLAYVTHGGRDPSPEYQAIDGVEFHRITSSRGPRRAAVYVSKRLQGIPAPACRGTSPELIETAERLARDRDRGQVIVGDLSAASALLELAVSRPVVYNAHNIESEYLHGPPGRRALWRWAMRRFESRLLAVADESWMVSRADLRSAQTLVPGARLRYAPNVVDVAAIAPVARGDARSGSGQPRLLMIGDFNYGPNMSGLRFLVEAVLPLVWSSRPEAKLTLVGRGLERWQAPDARIEVAGFVDSLDPYYAAADCVVVPLTEGAGTPLKFVEALAYGMPVVATPVAAKGLEVTAWTHYLRGDDARSFADAVIEVLRDGGRELGARARSLAEREYSIEALAERLARPVADDRGRPPADRLREADPMAEAPPIRLTAPLRWAVHAAGTGLGRRYPFVLCYHGVGSVAKGSDPSGIFVSRDLFQSHLEVIAERDYELVSVGELWSRMKDAGSAHAVNGVGSISFDDGLVKTVRDALPLLFGRGIRCSMFIPTGLMGQPHPDINGELIVSAEEILELADAGVEIGAHSVDHVRLSRLSYSDALDQMRRSRATLEDLLGKPVTVMAYPFGALNARTARAAREAGFEVACACSGPGPWRALSLPREPIYATATPLRVRLKMAGLYGPAHALVGERGPLRAVRSQRVKA